MTEKNVAEVLQQIGAQNIKGYELINNYGFTFEYLGKKYDTRYWANCYGVALNRWETSPIREEREEKQICKMIDDLLNG